jgi:fumarylacetoacetate (FAA) hydrolase
VLGPAWSGGRLSHVLAVDLNDQAFGRAEAGEECTFDFGTLIAHLAKTRSIGAGSIIGSGTVSNRDPDGSPGKPCAQGGRGYSCIAEQRMIETIADGKPTTEFLRYGDRVRIEMKDGKGHTIFGAIDHEVVRA